MKNDVNAKNIIKIRMVFFQRNAVQARLVHGCVSHACSQRTLLRMHLPGLILAVYLDKGVFPTVSLKPPGIITFTSFQCEQNLIHHL